MRTQRNAVRLRIALCLPLLGGLMAATVALSQVGQPGQSRQDKPADKPEKPAAAATPTAPWHDDPAVAPTQDPKALEVLKAGIKALGGEQAILGRKTIYIKRRCVNHEYPEPREGTITVWFKRPDKFRKEVSYPGEKHVVVFDGKSAYRDDGNGPQILGPTVTASTLDGVKELDMPANYLGADLTYFNITQEIPGKLAHVVKVRQHGYTRELMFDVTSGLLQVSGEYENPWGSTDRTLRFDRYRPVDGIMVPYRVEHWRSNEMVLETEVLEVRFNGPIEDSLFQVAGADPAGK